MTVDDDYLHELENKHFWVMMDIQNYLLALHEGESAMRQATEVLRGRVLDWRGDAAQYMRAEKWNDPDELEKENSNDS